MARIYVASSWRNTYHEDVVKFLINQGHEVYDFKNPPGKGAFAWSDIDPAWEQWETAELVKALDHPIAQSGFDSDFSGMQWADTCVMVLPCGRSANTEAGWMKGVGKRVFVYSPIPQEPELMYKLYDGISDSIERLNEMINTQVAGVCRICGCTWDNACCDPDYGSCWWVDETETLCSHCAPSSYENSLAAMKLIPGEREI